MPRIVAAALGLSMVATLGLASTGTMAQQPSCQTARGKIVGGGQARAAQWPGQAALRLHSDQGRVSQYFCGGTAITDHWVLTAAHCLPDFVTKLSGSLKNSGGMSYAARLEVVLDVDDLTNVPAGNVFAVERVVMHERYLAAVDKALAIGDATARAGALDRIAMEVGDDIALVRLARPWTGANSKLSLAASADPAAPSGTQVRVAGFGTTGHNRSNEQLDRFTRADGQGELFAGSATLLEAAVETVAPAACRSRYPGSMVGPGQICAGLEQSAKDSCQGDSGGPLVVLDADSCPRQIGVVSWGIGCADRDNSGLLYYGVYTRASAYADWIQKHTGPLKGAAPGAAAGGGNTLTVAQIDEAVRHLDSLLGAARGRVRIGIRGGNRARLGDKVIFEAASDIAGRLVILDINADREVTLLYPNRFVAQGDIGRIMAGAKIAVPGLDYPGFTSFQAVEPVGKGQLVALVVPEDFEIERTIALKSEINKGFVARNDPPSYLMRLIRQIETALAARGRASGAGADELQHWGYAVAEYEIVR